MSDTIYTVVSGDTSTKITKKFNISLDVFKKFNPTIKDVNKLSIGQKVKVGEEVVEELEVFNENDYLSWIYEDGYLANYEDEYTPISEMDFAIKMPDGAFKFDLKNFSDDWDSEFYEVHILKNKQKTLLQSGYLDEFAQTQVIKVFGSTPILLTLYINNDWIDINNDVKIDSVKDVKSEITDCTLTLDRLKSIDPCTSETSRNKHLTGLNKGFETFKINTCLRKAHFLAQVLHESMHLKAVKEFGGKNAGYSPFYGRGLIQITHPENYKAYGLSVKEDVYSSDSNRQKLENSPHCAKSACWFWDKKASLNDESDKNDFLKITYKVNGGFNGFKDRLSILKNAFKVFAIKNSTNFIFKESWIYSDYKASLAWGMWHDIGSKKFSASSCDASKVLAREGYERCIELTLNEKFPKYNSKGKIIKYYGQENPKTYAIGRLSKL